MKELDDFGEDYLRLTLEIDKHMGGYVDAYIGPPEIKAEVEAGAKKTSAALGEDLARLKESAPTQDPARHAYLRAIFRAMDCTLRLLAGEEFDYLDEVNRLYDISPHQLDEAIFTAAHKELDGLLTGKDPLGERVEAHRQRYNLATDQLLPLIDLILNEVRQRTRGFLDLVEGEQVEVRLTSNQPWSGYNWYRGNNCSLVEINTDIPVSVPDLVILIAHEAYPGHHTENQLKEQHLYREQGYVECASLLLHSPSGVIAEGIAMTAIEVVFPEGSQHDWIAEVLLPEAGFDPEPAEQMRRVADARRILRHVSSNAAILYHDGQLNRAQAIDYLQAYALVNEQRAAQLFRFFASPLFRSYIFTYTQGYELIRQAAHSGDKRPIVRRLLSEMILPSELAQMSA